MAHRDWERDIYLLWNLLWKTVELFFEFWRTAASFMRLPIQGPDSQEVMMNCACELMDVGTRTHLKIKVHKFVCNSRY